MGIGNIWSQIEKKNLLVRGIFGRVPEKNPSKIIMFIKCSVSLKKIIIMNLTVKKKTEGKCKKKENFLYHT
jgi:hypothetical protein